MSGLTYWLLRLLGFSRGRAMRATYLRRMRALLRKNERTFERLESEYAREIGRKTLAQMRANIAVLEADSSGAAT